MLFRKTRGLRLLSFLGVLLSRQNRVYLLSLLIPFAVYNLALKAYEVASRPEKFGLAQTIKLMRSDVFFNVGYALLWNGLFGAVHKRGGAAPRRGLSLPHHDDARGHL